MKVLNWVFRPLIPLAVALVVLPAWAEGGQAGRGGPPSGSQTEELGTINRILMETGTVWIGGRPYRITESTRCYVDEKPMTSITQLKVGQRASFQALRDGSLVALVVTSDD